MDVHWCYDKNNVVPEALRLINQAQWIAPHAFDFSRGLVDFVHLYEYLITKYSTFTAIFNCSGALSENKYLSVPFHVITRFYWSSATLIPMILWSMEQGAELMPAPLKITMPEKILPLQSLIRPVSQVQALTLKLRTQPL